jgi:hypothetical protein
MGARIVRKRGRPDLAFHHETREADHKRKPKRR